MTSPESPLAGSRGLVVARAAAMLVIFSAAFIVLRPFLAALTWAAILAYVTWPLHQRVVRVTGRPALSAALVTLALAIVLGIPVAIFLGKLATELASMAQSVIAWQQAGAPLPDWLTGSLYNNEEFEYIELHNISSNAVDLYEYDADTGH